MTLRKEIVECAKETIGAPTRKYSRERADILQTPETSFDCSGFVHYVFREVGLLVPDHIDTVGIRRPTRHANELFDHFGIAVHEEYRRPGDLIFMSRSGIVPTHIGIVAAENTFIHANIAKGVVEEGDIHTTPIIPKINQTLTYTHNPIGYKSPTTSLDSNDDRYHHRPID